MTTPRRAAAKYSSHWIEPVHVPPEALMAALWSFLSSGPEAEADAIQVVSRLRLGIEGPVSVLRDLESRWMKPKLLAACPPLDGYGRGKNVANLLGHILSIPAKGVFNRLNSLDKVAREMAVQVGDGSEEPGFDRFYPKADTPASRGRAVAANIGLESGISDPHVTGILVTGHLPPFHEWLHGSEPEAMQWHGCRVLLPLVNCQISKYVISDKQGLSLRYEFAVLDHGGTGILAASNRWVPVHFPLVAEVRFNDFGHGGKNSLLKSAREATK